MTTIPEHLTEAIHEFAGREGITPDAAAERLIGYGLNAVVEHDRLLESLRPSPYHVESCETYTDRDGETALTDYVEIAALPTIADARTALCGVLAPVDEDTRSVIETAPLGHAVAVGDSYYRITKSS